MSDHPNFETFLTEPAIKDAQDNILKALEIHKQNFSSIKGPQAARKLDYQLLLEQFKDIRGGAPLWHPYIGSGFGNGAFVELLDGSVKYDLICGIGPHYFGHAHPICVKACLDASLSDIVMQGNLQQNEDAFRLMKTLCKLSKMDHCFLSSSGAMAFENALKIAFQYKQPANRILAFERCFTGRSLATAQITDKPQYRQGLPSILSVDYVPFFDVTQPRKSIENTLTILKSHIKRYPGLHAAMCLELVQGEAGFYPGTKEFFMEILELLHHENIIAIADEVQTFGRTLSLFAMQYFEIEELIDIVTLGKISHTCATLYRRRIAPKPGLLSQTFTSSTSAIRATLAILEELTQNSYFGINGIIDRLHKSFSALLGSIQKKHPDLIKGPYGIGAMIAFTVYDGSHEKTTDFVKALFEAGIIAFLAGSSPSRVRFLPPIGILNDNDLNTIARIIEEVLLANR